MLEKLNIIKSQHDYSRNPDGMPKFIDFSTLSQEEKEKLAEEFSEGSSTLKETLLFLWNKDVDTMACCAGHPELGYPAGNPYLWFRVDELSKNVIKNILIGLTSNEDVINVCFENRYVDLDHDKNSAPTISFRIKKGSDFKSVLKLLKSAFKEKNNDKFDSLESAFSNKIKQQIELSMSLIDVDLAEVEGLDNICRIQTMIDSNVETPNRVFEKNPSGKSYVFDDCNVAVGDKHFCARYVTNEYYQSCIEKDTLEEFYLIIENDEVKAYTAEEVLEKGLMDWDSYEQSLFNKTLDAIKKHYTTNYRV